jgi:hypothetical protein
MHEAFERLLQQAPEQRSSPTLPITSTTAFRFVNSPTNVVVVVEVAQE